MHQITILPLATLGLVIAGAFYIDIVNGFSLRRRENPAVVRLAFERRPPQPSSKQRRDLEPRESGDSIPTPRSTIIGDTNYHNHYFCNFTLGTPPQNFNLAIDATYPGIWVQSANSTQPCQEQDGQCFAKGGYNASASSTYKHLSSELHWNNYINEYASDIFEMGSIKLDSLLFGIQYRVDTTDLQGVLGLAPNIVPETADTPAPYQNISNVPYAMASKGSIKAAAYSMWVDDSTSNTGSLLFGGVDTSKYRGPLQLIPYRPKMRQNHGAFQVNATSFSWTSSSGNHGYRFDNNTSIGGLYPPGTSEMTTSFDFNSPTTYIHYQVAFDLFNTYNLTQFEVGDAPLVNCSLAKEDYSIAFGFYGATLTVNISDLVLDTSVYGWPSNYSFDQPAFEGGTCILALVPSVDNNVIGWPVLRSAYVVYDLENQMIALAQRNFDSQAGTSSGGNNDTILEIEGGPKGIPGATSMPYTPPITTSTSSAAAAALATGYPPKRFGIAGLAGGASLLLAAL